MGICGDTVFAGTYGGMFVSADQGRRWWPANNGFDNDDIWRIYVYDGSVFASTLRGVFLSIDLGANWTAVNTGFTNYNVLAFERYGDAILAGTASGAYLTRNMGASWQKLDTAGLYLDICALAVNDRYLFAGTATRGVWRRALSELAPTHVVEKCTPNCDARRNQHVRHARNLLRLRTACSADHIQVGLYDPLGRNASAPIHGNPGQPGELTFNVSHLSRGTYFVKGAVGGRTVSAKVLIGE
jgi:hypothetical protein